MLEARSRLKGAVWHWQSPPRAAWERSQGAHPRQGLLHRDARGRGAGDPARCRRAGPGRADAERHRASSTWRPARAARRRRAAAGRDLPPELRHRARGAAGAMPRRWRRPRCRSSTWSTRRPTPCCAASCRRLRLVQVVHVTGEQTVAEALAIATLVDALLLDSGSPDAPVRLLGGTGKVHDWAISRRIVDDSPVPVFLAGGLTPGQCGRGHPRASGRSGSICAPACAPRASSTRPSSRPSCGRSRPPEAAASQWAVARRTASSRSISSSVL